MNITDVTFGKKKADGSVDVFIDFATNKDGAEFRELVRNHYGKARYSQKQGSKYLSEAIRALLDEEGVKTLAVGGPAEVVSSTKETDIRFLYGVLLGSALIGSILLLLSL